MAVTSQSRWVVACWVARETDQVKSVATSGRVPDAERKEFLEQAERLCCWLANKYEFALARAEVKPNEYRQLLGLEKLGKATMAQAAAELRRDPGHAGRELKELAKKGWVEVREGEDRRNTTVELTEAGKQMLAESKQQKEEIWARLVCPRNQEKRQRLLKALKEINELTEGWQYALRDSQTVKGKPSTLAEEEWERRRERKKTRLTRNPKKIQPAKWSGTASVEAGA